MNKHLLLGTWLVLTAVFFSHTCIGQVKAHIENFETLSEGKKDLGAAGLFSYGSIVNSLGSLQNPEAAKGANKSIQVEWKGQELYGGWGKGLGMEVDLNPETDFFNMLVASTAASPVTLQLFLQEDDSGDGAFQEDRDDSWTVEFTVDSSSSWQRFSIPLASFKDCNVGGDGKFNVSAVDGKLLALVINFPNLADAKETGSWFFDNVSLSEGELAFEDAMRDAAWPVMVKRSRKAMKDWEHMGDVVGSDKVLLGKNRLSVNLAYSMGRFMNFKPTPEDAGAYEEELRTALVLSARARLFEEVYVSGTVFKNFNPNTVQIWTADYYYSIGRFNWRPNTFSYGYENYMDNRYDDGQNFLNKFKQGYYFVSYGHEVPSKVFAPLKIDNTSNIKLSYFARYATHYRDIYNNLHGGILGGKSTLGMSVRYTVARNLYVESSVYQYIEPGTRKMPWDPDYSYGFGYFNYKSFRASLTYSNWIVNRFPWNKKEIQPYGLLDGDLRLGVNMNW